MQPPRPALPLQLQQQQAQPLLIQQQQQPVIDPVPIIPPNIAMTQPIIQPPPIIPMAIPSIPTVPTVPIIPGPQQPIVGNVQQPIIPIAPLISQAPVSNGALLIDSLVNVNTAAVPSVEPIVPILPQPQPAVVAPLPAPPTPPGGTQSRTMSISDKVPSLESPGSATGAGNADWAVKGPSKLRYTQLFNTTDHTRSGYLTGAQARSLLLQSKLPQASLAQIWALSDIDSDGRLSCDEFVLAMYLCEMATQGKPVPTKLPPDLVPPSFRKSASRHGSIASGPTSRHGSVSSQGQGQGRAPPIADVDLYSQTSFEDKRKENFDKGQAELDRRRKLLEGKYF